MSCILKIRESMNSLTKTEKLIGEYILANKDDFIRDSAQVLADKIGTSAAAVVRFSKKLGYRGLPDMKMELASESERYIPIDLTEAIEGEDSTEVLKSKTYLNYLNNCEKTYELIDLKVLEDSIQLIKQANRIYLFGIGASGVVCTDLYIKLTRIGYDVIYNADSHVQLASTAHMNEKDVCIGISYSGESKEVCVPIEAAKAKGVPVIGITRFNKNSLSKNCDYCFYIPYIEKSLRIGAIASRNAGLMITDLLYLGVARMDMEKTHKDLRSTHDLILQLKE